MTTSNIAEYLESFDEHFLSRTRKTLVHDLVEQERALAAIEARLAIFEDFPLGGDDRENSGCFVDREAAELLEAEIGSRLRELESAIARIDDGMYGWCQRCDQSIDAARLVAMPEGALCAACAENSMVVVDRGRNLSVLA